MSKVKAWLVDKLGLEPAKPKWLGLEKFSALGLVKQQLLLHPLFVMFVAPFAYHPTWWTALISAILVMGEHEVTQFKSRPPPKPCEHCGRSAGGRHLNLAERACDVLVGGAVGSQVLWWGWVLVQKLASS